MEVAKPAQRTSSRTVVIVAVVLLIVVAIAGIVLAGRRTSPVPGTAAAIPDAPAVSTPQAAAEPTPPANEVMFPPGSDKMAPQSGDLIAKFADNARGAGGMVRMSARFATGANKARDVELAKARTAAVRHALQANGVKGEQMQVELVEMPAGVVSEKAANRVELSLR